MAEPKDIDTYGTDDMVCPWCGSVNTDSWEYEPDSGTVDCWECDKPFDYERTVSVSYTTTKPKEAPRE